MWTPYWDWCWGDESANLLLSRGGGQIYKFDARPAARLEIRFLGEISEGRMTLSNFDYLRSETTAVDIVIIDVNGASERRR